jgi:hypothetical protein
MKSASLTSAACAGCFEMTQPSGVDVRRQGGRLVMAAGGWMPAKTHGAGLMYLERDCGLCEDRTQDPQELGGIMATQYVHAKDEHVGELNRRLLELKAAHAGLGASDDFEELFKITHGPGWTTLPEIFLMNALVDAAESNVRDARRLRKALVDGARTIGEASGE